MYKPRKRKRIQPTKIGECVCGKTIRIFILSDNQSEIDLSYHEELKKHQDSGYCTAINRDKHIDNILCHTSKS